MTKTLREDTHRHSFAGRSSLFPREATSPESSARDACEWHAFAASEPLQEPAGFVRATETPVDPQKTGKGRKGGQESYHGDSFFLALNGARMRRKTDRMKTGKLAKKLQSNRFVKPPKA